MNKNKGNSRGWRHPGVDTLHGHEWRVPPPENTDGKYLKEEKINISMCNFYVYYVENDGVFKAQPEFVDLDDAPYLKDNPDYKNNCEKINAMRIADIKIKKDLFYFIDDDGDVCSTNQEDIYEKWKDWQEQNAVYDKKSDYEDEKELEDEKIENRLKLSKDIVRLLEERNDKLTASDIDAHLHSSDIDLVKEICEELYHDGEINRTGNYRYYIFSKKETSSNNTKTNSSKDMDIESELEKFKRLLDKDLITEEDYKTKKKELLGLL